MFNPSKATYWFIAFNLGDLLIQILLNAHFNTIQVESITAEAEKLLQLFPDAQEHIATKHEEMVHSWNTLLEKAQTRKEKLQSAEHLQMYFNDYRELL